MDLEPYDYRDPGALITDIAARYELADGDVLLVLVRDAPGDQEVVDVSRLHPNQWRGLDYSELAHVLCDEARRMPIEERFTAGGRDHSIMTIVVRGGLAVIGSADELWVWAWLYSNHGMDAYTGDLIVLTEHGWTDHSTRWGGYEPRLAGHRV